MKCALTALLVDARPTPRGMRRSAAHAPIIHGAHLHDALQT